MTLPTILGLDPATLFGWSVRAPDGSHVSGVWDFRGLTGAERFLAAKAYVEDAISDHGVRLVAYEQPVAHTGTYAAHLYGGLEAQILIAAHACEVVARPVAVASAKTIATGKPHAKKAEMVAAALERWGVELGEDEADARWIAEAAAKELLEVLG